MLPHTMMLGPPHESLSTLQSSEYRSPRLHILSFYHQRSKCNNGFRNTFGLVDFRTERLGCFWLPIDIEPF